MIEKVQSLFKSCDEFMKVPYYRVSSINNHVMVIHLVLESH